MTAPRDPGDLASALLDGLLTDDEAAAARRDPAVAARLVELAAVREAVGRPPAGPDPATRERGVAAALDAYDDTRGRGAADELVGAAASPTGPRRTGERPATSVAAKPWRASGSARRRWLTAAAVVLVVAGLGVLARSWGTGSDDTDAQLTADESSNESGGADSAAEDAETGASDEGTATAGGAGGTIDLGDVGSQDALVDRARSALVARSSGAAPETSAGEDLGEQGAAEGEAGFLPSTCADGAEAERLASAPETVVLRARATLEGEPVDVWVLDAGGGERVVAVDASCAVVVDQPLQD